MKTQYVPKKYYSLVLILFLMSNFWATSALAQVPIKVCYHWLKEFSYQILTHKYNHAEKTGGELTFYGSSGMAGNGLYCAGNLYGSVSYGDRVVRVEFVEDVVFNNQIQYNTKTCGTNGAFYKDKAECDKQPWDVNFYDESSSWFVIRNEAAVQSWSANSDQLIKDLEVAQKTYPDYEAKYKRTIELIKAETSKKKAITYFNPKARASVWDIINDPKRLAAVPKLSLLSMLINSTHKKLTAAKKSELINTILESALKESSSNYQSLKQLTEQDSKFKTLLVSKLSATNANKYNPLILIEAIDNGDIKGSEAVVTELTRGLMKSATDPAQAVQLFSKLKEDSVFKKKYMQLLSSPQKLAAEVTEQSAATMLGLINLMATKDNTQAKEYSRVLFQKLINGNDSKAFDQAFASVTNPALKKDEIVGTLVAEKLGLKTKGGKIQGHPIQLANMISKFSSQLGAEKAQALLNEIKSLDIPLDKTSTGTLFQEYIEGKTVLSPKIHPFWYIQKLVKRALVEKETNKDLNVFTLIEDTVLLAYKRAVYGNYYASYSLSAPKVQAEYLELANELYKTGYTGYAGLVVANASVLKTDSFRNSRFERLTAYYMNGDPELDKTIESILSKATDANLLNFLVWVTKDRIYGHAKTRALLELQIRYLASDEFEKEISNPTRKMFQRDSLNLGPGAPEQKLFRGEICHFWKVVDAYQEYLNQIEPDLWPKIQFLRLKSEREFCRGN